jgi:hypothetical protein
MAQFLNISQPTVVRKLKKHSLPPPMIQTWILHENRWESFT